MTWHRCTAHEIRLLTCCSPAARQSSYSRQRSTAPRTLTRERTDYVSISGEMYHERKFDKCAEIQAWQAQSAAIIVYAKVIGLA